MLFSRGRSRANVGDVIRHPPLQTQTQTQTVTTTALGTAVTTIGRPDHIHRRNQSWRRREERDSVDEHGRRRRRRRSFERPQRPPPPSSLHPPPILPSFGRVRPKTNGLRRPLSSYGGSDGLGFGSGVGFGIGRGDAFGRFGIASRLRFPATTAIPAALPLHSSSTSLDAHALACAAYAAATTAAPHPPPPSFSHLLAAFLAGGIFFSAAIASIVAIAALGAENTRRVLSVLLSLSRRVWSIFVLGIGAARAALLSPDKMWNWSEGWKVLREGMGRTRRAAAEGYEAMRLEARLVAAAVGKPGLIALQYVVDRMMPKFVAASLEESLKDVLATIHDRNVKKVELTDFAVGQKPPELLDARAYDLGHDAIAFDVDIRWESEIEAHMSAKSTRLKGVSVPFSVRNVRFEGVLRVVLAPLTTDAPGYGAMLISLPVPPRIGLDVRMAGSEITRMPWLRTEILAAVQRGIEDECLWPRRVVVPSPAKPRKGRGGRIRTMLSKSELAELAMSDPLLRAEMEVAKRPAVAAAAAAAEYHRIDHRLDGFQSSGGFAAAAGVGSGNNDDDDDDDDDDNYNDNDNDNESLRLDVVLKDQDCIDDGKDDYCIVDSWSTGKRVETDSNFANGARKGLPHDAVHEHHLANAGSWHRAFEGAFRVIRNSTSINHVLMMADKKRTQKLHP